jgi:hypothetical protein
MESLVLKAEWWLERNLQEMPLMGEDRLRKEGENKVLSWMIENLNKEHKGYVAGRGGRPQLSFARTAKNSGLPH